MAGIIFFSLKIPFAFTQCQQVWENRFGVQISENMDSRIFAELVKQLAVSFTKMVPNGVVSTDV